MSSPHPPDGLPANSLPNNWEAVRLLDPDLERADSVHPALLILPEVTPQLALQGLEGTRERKRAVPEFD